MGYAAQLFFLAQSALFALSFACVALMARAIGGGRPAEARRALAASLVVSVGASLVLLLGIAAYPAPLLRRLSASPEVIALCVPYLRLLMSSTVLLSVCLTLESAFRADRDTKTPMRITLVVTTAKLALNVLLIFGAPAVGVPAFGVAGAGWATLIAQCVALALFVTVTRRKPASCAHHAAAARLPGPHALLPAPGPHRAAGRGRAHRDEPGDADLLRLHRDLRHRRGRRLHDRHPHPVLFVDTRDRLLAGGGDAGRPGARRRRRRAGRALGLARGAPRDSPRPW